jgi:tetratricopeptide (TPR) repeat protein
VTTLALVIAPLLLQGASAPPSDRFATLLDELRQSDGARYGCFQKQASILGPGDAKDVASSYQGSRGLPTASTARALLASLIEYALRPSEGAFETLRRALTEGGATGPAAEDVCRCVYFAGGQERSRLLASVTPEATGLFWAARVLHEAGRPDDALEYYRRSLEADPSDPRTRLLYAIALIDEERAGEALQVLDAVAPTWAPEPVAYWRARALIEAGDPAGARRLLEPLKTRWKDAPTVPDASIGAGPVQPTNPPVCLLGRALADEGDEATARALLEQNRTCRGEMGRLELRQGRPFDALLDLEESPSEDPLLLDALVQLKACEWALGDLSRWQQSCRTDGRPNGCSLLRKIGSQVSAACPGPAEQGSAGADTALEARLKAPRLVPFEERRIPAERRWVGKRPEQGRSARDYPALADFTIVALSEAAERMFAVSVSQDVDPRGEVSAGGYWLHLSGDRGRTWEGPYYLGIAEQFPYVIMPVTHVPPFDAGRVDIEVERREVDESTITFPPVDLRAKSVEKDLCLSFEIAAVERDSDGDGLTDLLEEKLVLDPLSPDTDGDGIPDGSDPLPLQPRSYEESSEPGPLLEAVMPYLFGGLTPIQQSAAAGREASAMSPQPRPLASARTLFISGGEAALPHGAGVRAVVLPPAVLEEYVGKFGATYPMALPDIAFDTDRQRALIRYDFGWSGGSLLAVRTNGHWTITPRGSWIT